MNINEYLETNRVNELAQQLQAEGYIVNVDVQPYDLVATKNGDRIAYEVKSRLTLAHTKEDILRLRQQAQQDGFTDFHLVIVSPPREKHIQIRGLTQALLNYIIDNNFAALDELPGWTRVQDVDAEANSVEVTEDGIHVIGSGTIEIEVEQGGGEEKDGVTWTEYFPFEFDVLLTHSMHLAEVYTLTIDTSAFWE